MKPLRHDDDDGQRRRSDATWNSVAKCCGGKWTFILLCDGPVGAVRCGRAAVSRLAGEGGRPPESISNEAFPFMGAMSTTVCGGLPARLFRLSFSGELAYEIAVPSRYGDGLVRALMDAGKDYDAVAYGTEALGSCVLKKATQRVTN